MPRRGLPSIDTSLGCYARLHRACGCDSQLVAFVIMHDTMISVELFSRYHSVGNGVLESRPCKQHMFNILYILIVILSHKYSRTEDNHALRIAMHSIHTHQSAASSMQVSHLTAPWHDMAAASLSWGWLLLCKVGWVGWGVMREHGAVIWHGLGRRARLLQGFMAWHGCCTPIMCVVVH